MNGEYSVIRQRHHLPATERGCMKPTLCVVGGEKIWLRKGQGEPSSDEQAATEVLVRHVYRRVSWGFDVLPGELWLDLGANVGAYAVYCRSKGANAVCYEPDVDNFRILQRNATGRFTCRPYAVTASKAPEIQFWRSKNPQNNYRGTEHQVHGYLEHVPVLNLWAGELKRERYCGVKMDIEGSEGPILDEWLMPRCDKLVMEYHTSRCSEVAALARRLKILKQHFKEVRYPKAFDAVIASGETHYRPRFDQTIFCWGER
jgi:FkbM family methyltransferase